MPVSSTFPNSRLIKLCFASKSQVKGDYAHLYFQRYMMRPSCLACPFASLARPSDLTMADCWGVEKALPGFADDNRGCSLLLVSTEAGRAFADHFDEDPQVREVDIRAFLQPNFQTPTWPISTPRASSGCTSGTVSRSCCGTSERIPGTIASPKRS